MLIKKIVSVIAGVGLSVTPMLMSLVSMPLLSEALPKAKDSPKCQCTQFVANSFGLRGFPHAGDWDGNYL